MPTLKTVVVNGQTLLYADGDGVYMPVGMQLTGSNTALGGKITVTTAGTPITPSSQAVTQGVTFIADPNNTGNVYVFPAAGAKTDVVPLAAGDSVFWPVDNVDTLKVDADVSSEGVYWMAGS